jgi:hypothetical protein
MPLKGMLLVKGFLVFQRLLEAGDKMLRCLLGKNMKEDEEGRKR